MSHFFGVEFNLNLQKGGTSAVRRWSKLENGLFFAGRDYGSVKEPQRRKSQDAADNAEDEFADFLVPLGGDDERERAADGDI